MTAPMRPITTDLDMILASGAVAHALVNLAYTVAEHSDIYPVAMNHSTSCLAHSFVRSLFLDLEAPEMAAIRGELYKLAAEDLRERARNRGETICEHIG